MDEDDEELEQTEPEEPKPPRTMPGRGIDHYKHTEDQPISPPLYGGINV